MNRNVQAFEVVSGGAAASLEQHRVLRNTYWLLALSMLPTVAGAWIGVSTGVLRMLSPMMSMIIFFAGAYGLMFAVRAKRDSAAGVGLLLAFTFFMGLMLSNLLGAVLGGYKNGGALVAMAFGGTATVFFGMAALATVVKRDLSGIARFMAIGMLIVIVGSVINAFVQSSAGMMVMALAVSVISSFFILFQVKQIFEGGETNYIMATLSIYISLFNLFQSLLMLLTGAAGDRD